MQWMVIGLCFLATWEFPGLGAKKMVVMMSRMVGRSLPYSWRNVLPMSRDKKNDLFRRESFHRKYGHPPRLEYNSPKNVHFVKNQYPQGGDDFDQGHDEVNHILVPHGKGITHGVSFGNGYIPYASYEDNPGSHSHHYDHKLEDVGAQTFHGGSSVNHPNRPGEIKWYSSGEADGYPDNEYSNEEELGDRRQGHATKKVGTSGVSSNDESIGRHYRREQQVQGASNKIDGYSLPPGEPQHISESNEKGIVLRDSIVLDDYHRKIAEITKKWPSIGPGANQPALQRNGIFGRFDATEKLPGPNPTANLVSILRNPRKNQGYAVKEDIIDVPHDFQNITVDTAPALRDRKYAHQIPQRRPPHEKFQLQSIQRFVLPQPAAETIQHSFIQTRLPVHYYAPLKA